jgi:pyridoxamine 5'-phosphate oxidase
LIPQNFEFWMEGEHRLHDRFCFERQGDSWRITCLAP